MNNRKKVILAEIARLERALKRTDNKEVRLIHEGSIRALSWVLSDRIGV